MGAFSDDALRRSRSRNVPQLYTSWCFVIRLGCTLMQPSRWPLPDYARHVCALSWYKGSMDCEAGAVTVLEGDHEAFKTDGRVFPEMVRPTAFANW